MIDLGDIYQVAVDIRDASGTLTNPTTATLTITLPDGTTSTPTVLLPPTETGKLRVDYLTVQAGAHRYRLVTTVPNTAHTDAFVVLPATPAMAISLADAKAHLGEQSTLQDEELRGYVAVATEIVDQIAGPTSVREFTERVRGGTWSLKLRKTPVASVTSITSIYTPTTTWATADLDVDTDYGYVYLKSQTAFTNGPWTAVYKAGRAELPARYVQAVKEQLWHMWVMQRGQLADSLTPDLTEVADFESRGPFGLGFLVPKRVMELLELDQIPGVA